MRAEEESKEIVVRSDQENVDSTLINVIIIVSALVFGACLLSICLYCNGYCRSHDDEKKIEDTEMVNGKQA